MDSKPVGPSRRLRCSKAPAPSGDESTFPILTPARGSSGDALMNAVALFRGPMHVMIRCSDEVIAIGGRDGRGVPVREAFPEEQYGPVQAAMDEVFVTGRTITLARPLGVLVIRPRIGARGRIVGVGTYFESAPVPRPTPDRQEPLPPVPQSQTVRAATEP